MEPHYVYSRKVTFAETDLAGCVHFSNYLKWMEEAEASFLTSIGEALISRDTDGMVGFPKAKVECEYIKPVFFNDELRICLALEKVGSCSVTYSLEFYRGEELVAKGSLRSVYVCRAKNGEDFFTAREFPNSLAVKLDRILV